MPPAFVGQRQQQTLGTILEEEWVDEGPFLAGQNGAKRREWPKRKQKTNHFGPKKTEGSRGGAGGRVGKMVDWWMGRGGQWPDEAQETEEHMREQQQMVTLAKTTIQLSPARESDGGSKNFNFADNIIRKLNNCTTPSSLNVDKTPKVPLENGGNGPKTTEKRLSDQQKSEGRGNEVSVLLQVVREHNVTISASCCFGDAAEKKLPPLFATTTARREVPLSFCTNEKGGGSGNKVTMPPNELRTNGTARDGTVVRKLELRMVDIELDEGEDDKDGLKWRRWRWHDGERQPLECEGDEGGGDVSAPNGTQQTTTGWAQFKRNREKQQRERQENGGLLPLRRHCPPQKPSPPFSSSPFLPSNCPSNAAQSAVAAAANCASANSVLPPLSPLCSPQTTAPPWLNLSNGSSSGVGSSVSSVSPKSTDDGEGERDNGSGHLAKNKNSGHKMEQYQHQFRHTTNSSTNRWPQQRNAPWDTAADYRVISLDMRPEPGRLEDFVPEVEREASNRATDGTTTTELDNCNGTNKAKETETAAEGHSAFSKVKTVVRENRNYDLESVNCWRRWSSLRRMPTTTANDAKRGAGTLPAKKREGKRTEEGPNDGEAEETLRRDERGRLIVDRREWRHFLAEQRTPSSRRVESRIRLLDACPDSSETDDVVEQKNGARKKPMVIVMVDDKVKYERQKQQQTIGEVKMSHAEQTAVGGNGTKGTPKTALLMMRTKSGGRDWAQAQPPWDDDGKEGAAAAHFWNENRRRE